MSVYYDDIKEGRLANESGVHETENKIDEASNERHATDKQKEASQPEGQSKAVAGPSHKATIQKDEQTAGTSSISVHKGITPIHTLV